MGLGILLVFFLILMIPLLGFELSGILQAEAYGGGGGGGGGGGSGGGGQKGPDPRVCGDMLCSELEDPMSPLEYTQITDSQLKYVEQDESGFILVDKQVQIVADVKNSLNRIQKFAYIVQVQDKSNVTVSLAWITGSLSPNQILSPALSWTPTYAGTYTATIFVWESLDNPTAMSRSLELEIKVADALQT